MKKEKSPKMPDSHWVYFVFNWGSPVACFSNAVLSLAFCRLMVKKWGNPLPEGALSVVRFKPAIDMYKFKSEDITPIIVKQLNKSVQND